MLDMLLVRIIRAITSHCFELEKERKEKGKEKLEGSWGGASGTEYVEDVSGKKECPSAYSVLCMYLIIMYVCIYIYIYIYIYI